MTFTVKHYGVVALLPLALLTGCGSDNNSPATASATQAAIVQTVAADFSASDVELVNIADNYEVSGSLLPVPASDYIIATHEDAFYHIGRFNIDTIAKYSITNIDSTAADYEYSLLDAPADPTANVQDMVFLSSDKAYLISYDNNAVWIVNPKAEREADFKLGEIDLSAYGDQDGRVEAAAGAIVDGKLYIALQRLNRNNGFSPVDNSAWVVVIDTSTDTEIDTNPNDAAGNLKGIELPINNPFEFEYNAATGLFVLGAGDPFGAAFYGRPLGYTGGIAKIDTSTNIASLLVDDGDDTSHPYGYFYNMAVIDADNAFFVGFAGFSASFSNITNLYHFNPTTGAVSVATNIATSDIDISELAAGPDGNVWVGVSDAANPRILLVDSSHTLVDTLLTQQNPKVIGFAEAVFE